MLLPPLLKARWLLQELDARSCEHRDPATIHMLCPGSGRCSARCTGNRPPRLNSAKRMIGVCLSYRHPARFRTAKVLRTPMVCYTSPPAARAESRLASSVVTIALACSSGRFNHGRACRRERHLHLADGSVPREMPPSLQPLQVNVCKHLQGNDCLTSLHAPNSVSIVMLALRRQGPRTQTQAPHGCKS